MTLTYHQYIEAKVLNEKCFRKYIDEGIYCLNILGKSELITEETQLLNKFDLFKNVPTSTEVYLKQKLTF